MNVVVTGASRGIGRAVAEVFAKAGADLIICARTQADLDACRNELMAVGGGNIQVHAWAYDVSVKQQALAFASRVKETWSEVDVLVNNAGNFLPGQLHKEEDGLLEDMINANLYSAYHITRSVLEVMMPHKNGDIINMCSVASIKAYPNGGSYSIAKFGLLGFSKTLREEMKEYNIRVTSIIAGATYTDSWKGAGIPESRFMAQEDIAQLVYDVVKIPRRAVVEDIIVRPMLGDI